MSITIKEFFDKYGLDNFEKKVDLNIMKKELYLDLRQILKNVVNFIDLITRSSTKYCGELMLSVALKQNPDILPVKNQIAICMNKNPSHLEPSYRHLEKNRYILIKESGGRKHVKLNYEEFPEMRLITELMKEFWECKKTRIKRLEAWRNEAYKKTQI